jgi:AAA+ superfamily predicted ATPase
MPTAEQVKALLKSYIENDQERFFSVAMQIAANEARQGHGRFAEELRALIDGARNRNPFPKAEVQPIPITRPRGELVGLLNVSYPSVRLSDMVLEPTIQQKLNRILNEQRSCDKLRSHGLAPRRKLLFVGPPGTGKTMTASLLAGELGIPLFVVRLDGLITKYMGETTAKLRLIFDAIEQTRGVYLFDEFDSIGTHRSAPHEVGEIRRVLNAFLMFLESDQSYGIITAATNRPQSLDQALYRRFDDVIEYSIPSQKFVIDLLKKKLALFPLSKDQLEIVASAAEGLSYAEISRACEDAMKEMILDDRTKFNVEDLLNSVREKKSYSSSNK